MKMVNVVSVLQKSLRKLNFPSFLIALTHPLQILLGHANCRENKMLLTLFVRSSTEEQKWKGETLRRLLVRLLGL